MKYGQIGCNRPFGCAFCPDTIIKSMVSSAPKPSPRDFAVLIAFDESSVRCAALRFAWAHCRRDTCAPGTALTTFDEDRDP